MNTENERRRETRMTVSWPVVLITSQGASNGKMINISASGSALICFSGPVEIDGEFSIVFNPSEDHEIYVPCEKIWSDKIIHEENVFNYSVAPGLIDSELEFIVDNAVMPLIDTRKPDALVLCCGADFLA